MTAASTLTNLPADILLLAESIVAGPAVHCGDQVQRRHTTCMHRGDAECTLVVTVEG